MSWRVIQEDGYWEGTGANRTYIPTEFWCECYVGGEDGWDNEGPFQTRAAAERAAFNLNKLPKPVARDHDHHDRLAAMNEELNRFVFGG